MSLRLVLPQGAPMTAGSPRRASRLRARQPMRCWSRPARAGADRRFRRSGTARAGESATPRTPACSSSPRPGSKILL